PGGWTQKDREFRFHERGVLWRPAGKVQPQAFGKGVLLKVGQEQGSPAPPRRTIAIVVAVGDPGRRAVGGRIGGDVGRREALVGVVEVVQRQAEMMQMVDALSAVRGFADLLDGGHEQTNENANNRDYHQQLDQRKPFVDILLSLHLGHPYENRMQSYYH